MPKQRLDLLVVQLGLCQTREAARTAIMDGGILVDGQIETKAGAQVAASARIEIAPGWGPPKYVSRGGLKLEKALAVFAVDPQAKICLDIGASTGGFTDCLLKHGAARVYAVDVGYGQLDWALRQDPKVVVKERINARSLAPEMLYRKDDPWAQLAVMDVSFISILKILPACLEVMDRASPDLICLIKPQFEAGRQAVGKGGVVRSASVQVEVIQSIVKAAADLGLHAHGLTFSPIKGPAGNIEFLVHLRLDQPGEKLPIAEIVEEAHRTLNA